MNDFDRAARRGIRDAPAAHLSWWLPNLPAGMRYEQLLESQSAPRPGEADRRCDTIFELAHPGGLGVPWAVLLELFTRLDSDWLDRLGEYLFRFRRELRHGPHDQDRYHWAALVVFLTECPAVTHLLDDLPGGDSQLLLRPRVICLAREDALATLTAIGDNHLSPAVLSWIPLMKGGNQPDTPALWREVCEACEPDEFRRRELAALALIFAELTDALPLWEANLEGFAVIESTIMRRERQEGLKEGLKEGQLSTQQEMLIRTLRLRFREAAEPLVPLVQAETNTDRLAQWFDLAITDDLDAIRKALAD